MHLLLLTSCFLGQPGDFLFDPRGIPGGAFREKVLKVEEKDGIVLEDVKFHSHMDGKRSIDVFGILAYPRGARGNPAFVWNQGGLYQATPHFPMLGARRGYAVLCIDFPLPGYRTTGGYPITSGLDLPADPKKAPIYQGAIVLHRAVSYLRSRQEVNPDRIGMAGSSWGGFYTTLMAGADLRLKACASMFGCGRLDLGNSWWDSRGPDPRFDAKFRHRWVQSLDPSRLLGKSRTPLGIFTGTNDSFYWLPAVDATMRGAGGPRHLALLPNWNHALTPAMDEQVFTWLDIHLKGARPFPVLSDLQTSQGKEDDILWKVTGEIQVKKAWLHVSFGPPGNWVSRFWMDVGARIDKGTCVARLPRFRTPCILIGSVEDERGRRTSTPLMLRPGFPDAESAVPDYDGCSMWGGFDESGRDFCRLHGYPLPKIDKVDGRPQAVFGPGKHVLPPILGTTDIPHELRLELQATKPGKIGCILRGSSDGMEKELDLSFDADTDWRKVVGRFTLPQGKSTSLRLHLHVPPDRMVRVNRVEFRPIRPGK